jgi:hypothetical protein
MEVVVRFYLRGNGLECPPFILIGYSFKSHVNGGM